MGGGEVVIFLFPSIHPTCIHSLLSSLPPPLSSFLLSFSPSLLLSFRFLSLQPLFSQERAPTSVAYAENQSMFLDSLVGDAAWRARYCKDRSGNRLPWALHEEDVRATHPYVNE